MKMNMNMNMNMNMGTWKKNAKRKENFILFAWQGQTKVFFSVKSNYGIYASYLLHNNAIQSFCIRMAQDCLELWMMRYHMQILMKDLGKEMFQLQIHHLMSR